MGLLEDESKNASGKRVHITEVEPFNDTFGPKAQRKRPRLDIGSMEELSQAATDAAEAKSKFGGVCAEDPQLTCCLSATTTNDTEEADPNHTVRSLASEPIYAKGTSRRIWGELYKVLDSSDVVIHVLDARDPLGTRCKPVVEFLRKEKAHKQLIYVLNKVDLVPTWVTVSSRIIPLFLFLPSPIIAYAPHSSQGPHAFILNISYVLGSVTRVEEQTLLRQPSHVPSCRCLACLCSGPHGVREAFCVSYQDRQTRVSVMEALGEGRTSGV